MDQDGNTHQAMEFLGIARYMIRPDEDTYAILLEGWANEGNVISATQTFAEMLMEIGWDPRNVSAYDTFLTTVIKGPDGIGEAMKFFAAMKERQCYPGMNFLKAAIEECERKGDGKDALLLWEAMVGGQGCKPDTEMYNSMITVQCHVMDSALAKRLLDEMVYNGAFPDSQTYNVLFHFVIKNRRLNEASPIFTEMIKNECVPSHSNCSLAVRIFMEGGDPHMAIKIWKCMIGNYKSDLKETGNLLVVGLLDDNRVPEAVKYAVDMIDRWIKLDSSTLSKLKQSLTYAGKAFVYDVLLRKWKTR
ncbi:unnamed protein product [Ilex paraguariensis]|uniref:Pentatricopeptide repeat-containing protein n=1 Tax=Ilex paraguariensis TaxID=185542 RepID=A0ABC8S2Z8_9AQUA